MTLFFQGLAALSLFLPSVGWCETPSLTSLSRRATELLTAHATAREPEASESALTALCDFYVLMHRDPRYATSGMLRGDAAKVRHRLIKTAHRLKHRLLRADVPRPDSLSSKVDDMLQSTARDFETGTLKRLSDLDRLHTDTATEGGSLPSDTIQGGEGGGAAIDNGWQLVELIERIVSPDFWDSRGGVGTIQYYAMRRVLVVRATSDVHEQIRDLLISLGW
ncbi:hypothetical protein Pla52o_26550 [Novipirellula galeiformis]|uniref:Uncharacterized protein n=1 Tax=Novipirellula galeiformis TaxID=2528004 RepID=A0A5C6CET6_9BACT|nr:hypothetical protein [Novipirellula galeiformis]TWU23120.1 hypothetical protein Pla52o_26550 [Novipirellula galeiformis]